MGWGGGALKEAAVSDLSDTSDTAAFSLFCHLPPNPSRTNNRYIYASTNSFTLNGSHSNCLP